MLETTEENIPDRTITLEEFRNLPVTSDPVKREPGVRFAFGNKEKHREQVEEVEKGLYKTVFFLEYKDVKMEGDIPTADIEVVQALVVK